MSLLSELFCSRVRASILCNLFGINRNRIHLRELQRRTELSLGTVRQDIRKLTHLNLVIAERDGNRLYYKANTKHPFYHDIKQLVIKSDGLADVITSALKDPNISHAFIFGSIATGEVEAYSDIDLMVIGQITLRKLVALLSGLSDTLGREINLHVMSLNEFLLRLHKNEHFVSSVMKSQKIHLIGTEHELKAMVE